MPRCGTTALYEYLRRHPQVFASWYKEIQFFGSDLRRYSRIGERGYAALFAGAARYAWRLDASTTGLMSEEAAREIQAYNPEARILIGLREPAEWLESMHGALTTWREEERGFAQALAEAPTRQGVPRAGCLDYHDYWRNVCMLPQQVERYLRVFGRERVFIYLMDDLREKEAFYARLCAWLQVAYVPPPPVWDNAREHLRYWRRIPGWLSGRARRRAVEWLLEVAPKLARPAYVLYRPVRAVLLRVLNGAAQTPPPQHYALNAEQKQALLRMLDELEICSGRDLSAWRVRLRA